MASKKHPRTTQRLSLPALRAEMARQRIPQWLLAARLGVAPTTLAGYLCRRITPPGRLEDRIEAALGLHPGTLRETEGRISTGHERVNPSFADGDVEGGAL